MITSIMTSLLSGCHYAAQNSETISRFHVSFDQWWSEGPVQTEPCASGSLPTPVLCTTDQPSVSSQAHL